MEIVHDLESQANENSPADDKKLEPHELVQRAHHFANLYKGLIVNLMFSYPEHTESRDFFTKRSAKQTLKMLEILKDCIVFLNEKIYISALYRRHKCAVQVKCSTSISVLYK